MLSSYKVYIDEKLDREEGWIRDTLLTQLSGEISISNKYDNELLLITFTDKDSKKSLSKEHLNLKFSGHNLSLFEEFNEESYKFKSKDELQDLIRPIKDFIKYSSFNLEQDVISKSNKNLKKIKSDLDSDLLRSFEERYLHILGLESISELNVFLKTTFPLFEVKSIFELGKDCVEKDLFCISNDFKLYLVSESEDESLVSLVFYAVFDLIKKIKTIKMKFQVKESAHIFKTLPYAITIYDHKNQSYNHNIHLSKLGITTRQLDSLFDGQTLDLQELGKYKVVRKDIGSTTSILSFVEIIDFEINFSNQSHEELGIVSSSIAHELNNPLGGILAALDVLLLDENPVEISDKFIQMKEGVQRCKELVETFLSFSRKDQRHSMTKVSMTSIVDQVIQLSRFRLIESNNQLKLNYVKINNNKYLKNSHLLTMCLYLIVGDLLTVKSRESLINQSSFSNTLQLEIIEDSSSIIISMENELVLSKEFLSSKLFNYILDILNIKLIEIEGAKKLFFS